jgi:Family of unknown function (DUF6502)
MHIAARKFSTARCVMQKTAPPVDEARRKTTMDRRRVRSLLNPIAAFLCAGGFTKTEAMAAFSSVLDAFQKGRKNRRMDHIGHPTSYADLIATWTRDRRYVDATGKPRVLSLSGRNGFTSLVRCVSPHTTTKAVLSVLLRYRNIRRLKDGRYSLVNPFFYTNSVNVTAFEPIAFFLSDASSTLSQILRRRNRSPKPERFWRKVETFHVSEAVAKRFLAFARDRSFLFLEELDDWLQAHRDIATSNVRKRRRIGLGLFSIYSDYESTSPKH